MREGELSAAQGTLTRAEPSRPQYVREDIEECLKVYRGLLAAFDACELHAAPYLNIVAVFFHDLMVILTGLTLKDREVRGPYRPHEAVLATFGERFPYFGFADVMSPDRSRPKDFRPENFEVSRSRQFASSASRVVGSARRQVAFGKPSALHLPQLVRGAARRRWRIHFPEPMPVAIPNVCRQIDVLTDKVDEILEVLSLERLSTLVKTVLRGHILAQARDTDLHPVPWDILIAGSMAEPFNRYIAARTRADGKPVVAVAHGEAEGVLDEPLFGGGERTYATHLLGYGPAGRHISRVGAFTHSLYEMPLYVESDGELVSRLYSGTPLKDLVALDGMSIVYVPTSLSGGGRYGPFRDLPDLLYQRWWGEVIEAFPGLIVKSHPKSAVQPQLPPGTEIDATRSFEWLQRADVFIFDYASTALTLAAATDKPIVFLDVGLRNLSRSARTALERRCVFLSVDPTRPTDLRDRVTACLGEACHNAYTHQHSLATVPAKRVATLFRVSNELLA